MSETPADEPIRTEPNTTHYEWAGRTLQRLLGTARPVAETWAFFSGPSQPARIADPGGASAITMADLVERHPEVLGAAGADPENRGQKYFFVKFLDPSDFPPFAYVGFDPEAVAALRRELQTDAGARAATDEEWPARFRAYVADLLWRDRQAASAFAELIRPRVRVREDFARLKAAYKAWAIGQALANWASDAAMDLAPFVDSATLPQARALLDRQRDLRRRVTGCMHRVDFEEDQAILVETPTLHAIAGLSLQVHPKAPGNFHPKDELWLYKPVRLPDGGAGWILVEPQRTFDVTESAGDFFTPFTWEGAGASGRLGFRKPITKASLNGFVTLMDATPHPRTHYLRRAARMSVDGGTTKGTAQWYRLVEEPGWPYFLARELRFEGLGEAVTPLAHHSFVELHVTHGAVEVTLSTQGRTMSPFLVAPPQPLLLPASLPHDTITYRAEEPAHLQFFTRPRPR